MCLLPIKKRKEIHVKKIMGGLKLHFKLKDFLSLVFLNKEFVLLYTFSYLLLAMQKCLIQIYFLSTAHVKHIWRQLELDSVTEKNNIVSLMTVAKIHVSPPLIEKEKKTPWQNDYKGLFSAAWDCPPHPLTTPSSASFRQRGYTWINCEEQRLNYLGWRITQGFFCCPARTRSHPTPSCQRVFFSNSHSSKKRVTLLSIIYFCLSVFLSFCHTYLKQSLHRSQKLCRTIFGICSAVVRFKGAIDTCLIVLLPYIGNKIVGPIGPHWSFCQS